MKTTGEFEKLNETLNQLRNVIKERIGYFLCEIAFRIDEETNNCFDDNLEVKKDCSLWNRFLIWISWHLYHTGCWFYN